MTRHRLIAGSVIVAVAGALLVACGEDKLAPGEFRLVVDGRAEVAFGSKPFHAERGTRRLHRGDRVRVTQGSARVELSDDRSLELRRDSAVTVDEPLSLMTGDALAKAPGTALTIRTVMADVVVTRGTSRVNAALAVRAAAYVGDVDIDSAGRRLHVGALRQAVVPTPGLVPDRPSPISYDAADAWDRRYLGDAVQLGEELANRSRGLAAQVTSGEGSTAAYYRVAFPQLATEPAFADASVDPSRSVGETFVGTAIVVSGNHGSFAERWASVFEFRDDGADWGIVARDQDVVRAALLDELDRAIARALTPFTGPAPPIGPGASPTPSLPLVVPPSAPPPPPATTTTTRRRPSRTTTTTLTPPGLTIPTVTIPNR